MNLKIIFQTKLAKETLYYLGANLKLCKDYPYTVVYIRNIYIVVQKLVIHCQQPD